MEPSRVLQRALRSTDPLPAGAKQSLAANIAVAEDTKSIVARCCAGSSLNREFESETRWADADLRAQVEQLLAMIDCQSRELGPLASARRRAM